MRIPLRLLCLVTVLFILSFIPPGGKKRKFIDPANMDLSVRPGDDFYLYANGTWIKNNPVPASKTRWGSFDQLNQDNLARLRTLLESAAATADKDARLQKIGDLYLSGMDSTALESMGYQPIRPDLDRIASITDARGILKEVAYERSHGIASPLIGFFVGPAGKMSASIYPRYNKVVLHFRIAIIT
jgi:putative endopeptidase